MPPPPSIPSHSSADRRLNPQQEQVAAHFAGRALVVAGPGSGKTSTITARIGRLLAKQVKPEEILCITFTNKAAQEMRHRIEQNYGAAGKRIHIGTFHALCVELLRNYGHLIGYTPRLTILDSDDQEELMAQIARQKYANHPEVEITRPKIRKLLAIVNNWRENLQPDSVLEGLVEEEEGGIEETELAVIKEYLHRMRRNDQIDFSGLLSETVRLLKHKQPEIKPEEQLLFRLNRRWRFLQVDEYQDTNTAQNEIVELLSGMADNLLAVGDQDQSIYEWRGANPEGIAKFINRGKAKRGCKVYQLSVNYRSTPEIIAAANTLIRHSPNRMAIEFTAHSPSLGKPPQVERCNMPEDEASAVAEKVKALMNIRNVPANEIAVFFRLNDMSRPIEQALARRQVPYKVIGGLSFFDRAEVRDCIAMLRLLSNPRDSAAFTRVVNKPKRGIGEKAIGAVENYAAEAKLDLIAACAHGPEIFGGRDVGEHIRDIHNIYSFPQGNLSVADCLAEVLRRGRYNEYIESSEKDDRLKIDERKRNVQELISSIALYCQDNPDATIAGYLQYIALLTSGDEKDTRDSVKLMSLHSSKGLEFDVVFMVGVEDGLLPHRKAIEERPEAGFAEERRLCYVGMTRARKQLFISYCQLRQNGFVRGRGLKVEGRKPSTYLLEAGLITKADVERAARPSLVS